MTTAPNADEVEVRRQRTYERLGTDIPACRVCGENDWRTLEAHHIAGRAYAEHVTILCRNCHAKQTDVQSDFPKDASDEIPLLVRIAHYLLGLAALAREVTTQLLDYANALLIAAARCPAPWGYLQGGEQ